jgi:hypothetical protein
MSNSPRYRIGIAVPILVLLLTSMCASPPPPPPASGDAIAAAVSNAEAELAKVRGDDDA